MLTQQMSSSATPCSRMNSVTVFLGVLDLQDGKVKENLKKKVEESRSKMSVTEFSNLLLSFHEGKTGQSSLKDIKIKPN